MKKNYFLLLCSLLLAFTMQAQVSYSGNGNTGFGGALGSNTLNLSDDGTTITFDFASSIASNNIVIYIDSKSGGFADTTSFTDEADGGRSATSTTNSGNDPEVTFPSGFTADYAVTVGSGFAVLFELSTGSHTATGLSFSSGDTSVTFTQLGISATDKFDFVAILNSDTSFLSDEVIGDSSVSGNPGFAGSITFTGGRSYPNTWTGATDNDWATGSNWTNGVPDSNDNVYIPNVTNKPTAGSAVTINKGIIKSGATLIAQDAFTGTLTYERALGTTNWYLVSSPLSGETMTDMRANNSFNTNGSSEISFAPYDNSQASASDRWSYFSNTATTALIDGKGYSTQLSATGNITFSGNMNTSDVSIALTQGGGSGNNFNLIGNPFLSFINGATFLGNETSDLSSETIWIWNQSSSSYDTFTPGANPNFKIAPGQGFFVEANSTNNVSLTEAIQSHESTDTFQRNASRPEIFLNISDNSQLRKTRIIYDNNATTDFDNGYDGKMFNGVSQSLGVFTHVLTNNSGDNFAVQMLPNLNHEDMVVPVGIIADAGNEITFTAEALNLPSGLKVFLEDRELSTITRLDEANSNYKITLNNALNGTGRFYLHTSSSALSINDITLEGVNVFALNRNTLRINGINSERVSVKLFNILGKNVLSKSFSSKGDSEISLPNLSTGVYIVQLSSEKGKTSKKIVLE